MSQPGPALADVEIVTLEGMLSRGLIPPSERNAAYATIAERRERVLAGLARAPQDWDRKIKAEVDPLCRVRWEFEGTLLKDGGWVIDRWVEQDKCWTPVAVGVELDQRLIDMMQEHDLQRLDPMVYLEKKRAAAKAKQRANEMAGRERIAALVDSLTDAQVDQFIAVEEAIAAGDSITARGSDARTMENLNKQARANAAAAVSHPVQSPQRGFGNRFKKLSRVPTRRPV
jgi:hypothetical protein